MAILSAMQSATTRLVGQRPSVFFGSGNQLEIEICDLINEVAKIVAEHHDWQKLTKIGTITGDGATEDFDLPSDYDRQMVRSDMQDLESWAWGYTHVVDVNEFLYLKARNFIPLPGAWTIYGGQFHFAPAPASGATATYPYISKEYAIDSGTLSPKAAFDSDTDTFVLSGRLLTLGLVWKWRENKKLDFTGDQEAFETQLNNDAAQDKGSRIIRRGRRNPFPGTYLAWPYELGNP